MSLTNPNTPVSQQDLQDFYHKLLPYMGGSFGLVATGIDSANLYSTTERVIGQWIDGKPLYQRVVDCGTLTNKPDVYIPVSGSSEMNVVNMHGFIENNGVVDPLPYVHDTELANMIAVKFSKSSGICIFARNNTGIGGFHAYVTLQYTKTTDSAVDSYGTDTTFSTDEHVVGSWIDGSPLYQKTVAINSLTLDAETKVAHNIANVDFIANVFGVAFTTTGQSIPIPFYNKSTTYNIFVIADRTYVSVYNYGLVDRKAYVTLQYTKTT